MIGSSVLVPPGPVIWSRRVFKFGVEIPDDQLKDLKTVQDVVSYVHKNVS